MIPQNMLFALALGATIGGVLARTEEAVPALAQMGSPTPTAPQPTTQPMPRASGMMGSQMTQMMHMMPPMKSAADRAYMGAMMQMHGGMMRITMNGNADQQSLWHKLNCSTAATHA